MKDSVRKIITVAAAAAFAAVAVSCATTPASDDSARRSSDDASVSVVYPSRPVGFPIMDFASLRDRTVWGYLNAHDPSIFFDQASGYYYIYSTDLQKGMLTQPGCQIRKSRNLVDWEFVGWALADGVPPDVASWVSAMSLWAPDCVRVGDEYRMYYSVSHFGKQRSAIALAVSPSPEGPFVSRGIVVKTDEGDPVNAIDPVIVTDASNGKQYMSYGSFWSGIRMLPLDEKTGLVAADSSGFGIPIASRSRSVDGAIEGSYIIHNAETGYYYLFVSFGSLFSDYNVRVARSRSVTGPYLDRNGVAMTDTSVPPDSVGNKILAGYRFGEGQGWIAPGHNSVLHHGNDWFIVHHMRPENDTSWAYLCVRKMLWSDDGWPVVSPMSYAGETKQGFGSSEIAGTYEMIRIGTPSPDKVRASTACTLNKNGTFACQTESGFSVKGKWVLSEGNKISLTVTSSSSGNGDKGGINGMVVFALPSWDRDQDAPVVSLTGTDGNGFDVWARKTVTPR